MERSAAQPIYRRVGPILIRALPFVLLALGGLFVSAYELMYPAHFAENCEFSVSTRQLRVIYNQGLIGDNLAWIIPSIPLILLGHQSYVRVVYSVVAGLFLFLILNIVPEDLVGSGACC